MMPWWLYALKNQLRIRLASGLPMLRMGTEAPTCSSSNPLAIAVPLLAETPSPASMQLVKGTLVINNSANMPLIWNEFIYLLLQKQGNSMFIYYPWVRQLQFDQGGLSQIFILRQSRSEKWLFSLFYWKQFLVHQRIELILYFFLSCEQINSDCLCDQLIVQNSL